MQIDIEMNH